MLSLIDWLKGKKSYITAALIVSGGIAVYFGVVIPEWIWLILGGLGVGFVRAGVGKVEQALKTSG